MSEDSTRERFDAAVNLLHGGVLWVNRSTSAVPEFFGRRFLRLGSSVVGSEVRLRGEQGRVAEGAATGVLMSTFSALLLVWYVDLLVGYSLDEDIYGLVVMGSGSLWATVSAVFEVRNDGQTGREEMDPTPPRRESIPGYVRPWRGARERIPGYVRPEQRSSTEESRRSVRRVTVLGVGAVLFITGVVLRVLTGLGPPLAGVFGVDGPLFSTSWLNGVFLVVIVVTVLTVDFHEVFWTRKDWTLLWYLVALFVLVGIAYAFVGPATAGLLGVVGTIVGQTAALMVLVYHSLLTGRAVFSPLRRRLPYERQS